jgi:hypothetical protein
LRLAEKFSRQVRCNEPLSTEDIQTATGMYRDLYLGKYSVENADYSESFVEQALKAGLLQSLTLRDEQGALLGFLGFYENGEQIACPMIGWKDPGDGSSSAYRILMIEAFRRALESGKVLNWSSGVAHFKTLRGGVPAIEYLCIQPENDLQRMMFAALAKFNRSVARNARVKRAFDA